MSTLQPGTVVSDRFEILLPLQPAGAGRLYRAKDREAEGKTVTLEVIDSPLSAIDPKMVEAFVKDTASGAEVPHDGIARVLGAGSDGSNGLLWVAMEPLEGETLRDRMARGAVSPRETLGIVQRILDVLAAAHARSAVHRGLTPEDVILVRRPDGTEGVELLDFGFARHLAAPPGSPYISPEQARSSSWVTPAADVFSLGGIFYEMVTGRAPGDPLVPVRDLAPTTPPPIATLIDKTLARDPADRPTDAAAVRNEIQKILAPPPPPPQAYAPPMPGGGFGARTPGAPFGPPPGAAPAYAGAPYVSPQQSPPKKSGGWGWIVGLIAVAALCLIAPFALAIVGMAVAISDRGSYQPPPYDPYPYQPPTPTPFDPNGPLLPTPMPTPSAVERYNLPVTVAQPQRGPADALVTIVEFSDFQCPFCKRVEPTLQQLIDSYPGQVRVVWRNNPLAFHTRADPAAQLAMEAHRQGGNEAFWRMHALLFENNTALERADLLRYAAQAGIDVSRARRAIDDREHALAISVDQALATQLGATGTPSFFINGRPLVGAQPYESFRQLVDEEIAHANALVGSGVPRDQIYESIVRDAPAQQLPSLGGGDAPDAPDPLGGLGLGGGDPDPVYALAVPADAPMRGRNGAPVTIQIASDFQCPFCSRVRATLDRLLQERRSDVRLVWRDYPLAFHQNAMLAAEAAREARAQGGDRKFWRMHDLLFENQHALERADLERYAEQTGLNMSRFRAALDGHVHQPAIQADMSAIDATGASIGTPSFFVNGRLVQGAQPYESFDAAVTRALAER